MHELLRSECYDHAGNNKGNYPSGRWSRESARRRHRRALRHGPNNVSRTSFLNSQRICFLAIIICCTLGVDAFPCLYSGAAIGQFTPRSCLVASGYSYSFSFTKKAGVRRSAWILECVHVITPLVSKSDELDELSGDIHCFSEDQQSPGVIRELGLLNVLPSLWFFSLYLHLFE